MRDSQGQAPCRRPRRQQYEKTGRFCRNQPESRRKSPTKTLENSERIEEKSPALGGALFRVAGAVVTFEGDARTEMFEPLWDGRLGSRRGATTRRSGRRRA
jgi:hypothetical protein